MRQNLSIRPQASLLMTFQMREALQILQMTQIELGPYLREAIERNPLLKESPHSSVPYYERDLPTKPSIYEHLQRQINECFDEKEDLNVAKRLFEGLDEKGFLTSPSEIPLKHHRILRMLQSLDPPGVFARNLQECFLIQLKRQKNRHAVQLVEENYFDLLHGRFGALKKKYKDLNSLIASLSRLERRPFDSFREEGIRPITPDLIFEKTETGWEIRIDQSELPLVTLINSYDSSSFTPEEKKTVQQWTSSAKGLLNSLSKRKEILFQIGANLLKRQASFLLQKGPLLPLTVGELKEETGLHESTIYRALSEKYVETPRGLILLKNLLTSSEEKRNAKDIIKKLIDEESRRNPLSDEQLTLVLQEKGVRVARRTVSKYRKELKISSAKYRVKR